MMGSRERSRSSREQMREQIDIRQRFEEVEIADAQRILLEKKIREIAKNPENMIGEGGIGEVFAVGERFCVKLMKKIPDRTGGSRNSVLKEAEIQSSIDHLELGGVRIPKCFACWEVEAGDVVRSAIVMERLDAVNLQLVLNGDQEAPESFDPQTFAEDLQGFLEEVHDAGVLHNDLWPRNVMIDRQSGKARLIDFGNSRRVVGINKRREEQQKNKELIEFLEERIEKPIHDKFGT